MIKVEKSRSRLGRPSPEVSRRRHDELLSCALDIFLERGFEQTTTAQIAAAAGMSKRTLYSHYEDKSELFKAAVYRAAELYTIPSTRFDSLPKEDLEKTLMEVARIRIENVATPNGVKLLRILASQSYQFPELFREVMGRVTASSVEFLVNLFTYHQAKGTIVVDDARRASVSFLSLVVGGPTRLVTAGRRLDRAEVTAQIQFAVQLFLNGIRRRE